MWLLLFFLSYLPYLPALVAGRIFVNCKNGQGELFYNKNYERF